MEILKRFQRTRVKAVLFDFDGTISTLRCGWEEVMGPLMVEKILACGRVRTPLKMIVKTDEFVRQFRRDCASFPL